MSDQDKLDRLLAAKAAHGQVISDIFTAHGTNRVVASGDEWDRMEHASRGERDALEAVMPTEQDAINMIAYAAQRLKQLGWNDIIYCPKDGSEFDAIEVGSTGIHKTHYSGEWPNGHWWVAAAGDIWPSRPCLYRKTEAEIARWAKFGKLASGIEARSDETLAAQPEGQEPGGDSRDAQPSSNNAAVSATAPSRNPSPQARQDMRATRAVRRAQKGPHHD